MIDLQAYLMGRDKEFPPTKEMLGHANDLLQRVEDLFYDLGIPLHNDDLSSGYRPGRYNVAAGGSKNSTHLMCQGLDLKDKSGFLVKKIKENLHLLEKHGLYMEDPEFTKGWVHLQTRATIKRIFRPY